MQLELSPQAHIAVLALLTEALATRSDASLLLGEVASQLKLTDQRLPAHVRDNPTIMANLRQAGFIKSQPTAVNKTPFAAQPSPLDSF